MYMYTYVHVHICTCTHMYICTCVLYVYVYICTYVHVYYVHVYNSVCCALHMPYMLLHPPLYGFYNKDASKEGRNGYLFEVSNIDSWGLVASKSVPLGCISRVNVCKYGKLASYPGQVFLLPHGLGMRLMVCYYVVTNSMSPLSCLWRLGEFPTLGHETSFPPNGDGRLGSPSPPTPQVEDFVCPFCSVWWT